MQNMESGIRKRKRNQNWNIFLSFFLVKKCATLNTVFNMPCCHIFLPVISIDDSGRLNLMFIIDNRAL